MSTKQKLLACLMALVVAFGCGALVGYRMDRGVDPQDNIKTVFTPYDDGIGNFLAFLDRANKSVHIADYSFTDPRIVDKLIELKTERKVDVHLLLDLSQTQGRSGDHEKGQIDRLKAVGIEAVVGTSEKSHAIMHNKYCVVDDEWVESGSWNYTKSANDQDNVQDYIRSKKRAALFMDNWRRMHTFMKAQESKREAQSAPANDDDDADDSAGEEKAPKKARGKSTGKHAR